MDGVEAGRWARVSGLPDVLGSTVVAWLETLYKLFAAVQKKGKEQKVRIYLTMM